MAIGELGNGAPDMPESNASPLSFPSTGVEAEAAELSEPSPPPQEEEMEEEEDGAGGDGLQQATKAPAAAPAAEEVKKWPGWPGDNVFRMIVPVLKVGSIIGRKGELIKKLCEETRARVRILEGAIGTSDRIVLISGQEEPEAAVSPAMNAALRIFKRINGITESEDGTLAAPAGSTVCSIRLLVASSQAINLIGKGGMSIKSIQEGSGATLRVLSKEEVPFYATSDERIVEIQGESLKVLKALDGVVGHLRKFLVDHSVVSLFEKTHSSAASSIPQNHAADAWAESTPSLKQISHTGITSDYPIQLKRDSLFVDRETQHDSQTQRSGLSLYGQDPAIARSRSSGLGHPMAALITQVTQTMQIPLSYAEDIIGVAGKNIAYIRRGSGAAITLQETRGLPSEMTVEIKGTAEQVQSAQELINEFVSGRKEPALSSYASSYGGVDTGLRSSYSQLPSATYPSMRSQTYGGYGSSGISGYDRYRY